MALAHKELEAEFEPWHFTEKDKLEFCDAKTVPVLVDGGQAVADSWNIANFLEESYPDNPSLFGGEAGRAVTGFINAWTDSTLHPAMIRCLVPDIYERIHPVDKDYFKASREKRFGMSLDEIRGKQSDFLGGLDTALTPLRTILGAENGIAGEAPAYAVYIIFGAVQWARVISPLEIVASDDPIRAWRERMLDLFDGLARGFKSAA